VHVEVALVTHHARLVEVMVDFPVRYAISFPGERLGTREMHLTRGAQQVRLHQRIRRIDEPHTVRDERVAIVVRLERLCGYGPQNLVILLHDDRAPTLKAYFNLLCIGSAKAEGHSVVGANLRRDYGRGRWCGVPGNPVVGLLGLRWWRLRKCSRQK